MNSRALLWGGALVAAALVVAAVLVPFVYVALALAVLLLVALVVANRMRVASDESREADNDESTSRLSDLSDLGDESVERYDASAFDSLLVRPDDRPDHDEPEPAAYEEFAEPRAEWTTGDFDGSPSFVDDAPSSGADTVSYESYERYDDFRADDTSFAPTDYSRTDYSRTNFPRTDYSPEAPVSDPAIAFEEYTGPARSEAFEREYDYETSLLDEPVIDESIIEEVDATSVLADEGLIDESKVTSTESILAASQASRFEPEQMSDEESNAETREILGRVAALLAKYE